MFNLSAKKSVFGKVRGGVETFLAASVLCLVLGGQVAFAIDAASTTTTQQQTRLTQLKTTLKLTDAQSALLQKADTASTASQKVMLDEQIKRLQARRDALNSTATAPDLRKLAAEQDAAQAVRTAEQKKVRESWLTFYDALSAEQKLDAAKFVQARMAMGGGDMMAGRAGKGGMKGSMGNAGGMANMMGSGGHGIGRGGR